MMKFIPMMSAPSKPWLSAILLSVVTLMPLSASAQAASCISRAESQAIVSHLMPDLLDRVEARCSPLLGPTSYLASEASALSTRFSPLSRRSWPAAKRALERQSGKALPDNEFILDLGRRAIADGVAKEMDAKSCAVLDDLLVELQPLPPQNLANIFSLLLEAGVNSDPNSPLKVCPANRP